MAGLAARRARHRRAPDVVTTLGAVGEVVRCRITRTAAKVTSQRLHVVAHGFDDVYAGPGLTPPQRQLVTLGALTAMGGCEPSCACA